jgi:hypothetical protein
MVDILLPMRKTRSRIPQSYAAPNAATAVSAFPTIPSPGNKPDTTVSLLKRMNSAFIDYLMSREKMRPATQGPFRLVQNRFHL